jgi:hypothetical protein
MVREMNELTEEEKNVALTNAVGKPPEENELGGGVYYTCFWKACGETLYRWYNFCPRCGQRIDWSGL